MIDKNQAVKIARLYTSQFVERVSTTLEASCRAGILTVVVSYGGATAADVDRAVAALAAANWVVVRDDSGQTLTISDR